MTATPNTAALQDLLQRVEAPTVALMAGFQLGSAGKILDSDGRLICTMNLADLTLGEAFAYASYFMASLDLATEARALIATQPTRANEGET